MAEIAWCSFDKTIDLYIIFPYFQQWGSLLTLKRIILLYIPAGRKGKKRKRAGSDGDNTDDGDFVPGDEDEAEEMEDDDDEEGEAEAEDSDSEYKTRGNPAAYHFNRSWVSSFLISVVSL